MQVPSEFPPVADRLRVGIGVSRDRRRLEFPWAADEDSSGTIIVTYPRMLSDEVDAVLPFVTLGVGVYLAQLCLASTIEIDAGLAPEALTDIAPVAQMLYDIRCWKDRRPLLPPPRITTSAALQRSRPIATPRSTEPPVTTLLLSGGKDSTLSAVRLLADGWSVQGLHMLVNHGVEDRELAAARDIAAELAIPLDLVSVEHPEFLELSTRYAVEWNRFPLCNIVPFGRDLLTTVLALPYLVAAGLQRLSLGHDAECRAAWVEHEGRRIPRNDIESAEGANALQDAIRATALADFEFLPPVADLDELEILRLMLTEHLDLMLRTSFCFWGDNCGRCAKCLRYHLAQRVFLPQDALSFQIDPLTVGANPELEEVLSSAADARPQLFEEQVLRCIARAVQSDRIDPHAGALAGHFNSIRERTEAMTQAEQAG